MSGATGPRCGICGARARKPFQAPVPELAPDLDMRPGDPAWETLPDWLQSCDRCGAVAHDLAALPASARSVVESAEYRSLADERSEPTLPFRRWAVLCKANGDAEAAIEATLMAAWAADDTVGMLEASRLRLAVADSWGETEDQSKALWRLDVLRRSSNFAAADRWAEQLERRKLDEAAKAIVAFQRRCIGKRDIGRHLVTSALPPGISHAHLPRPQFWSWLFG